MLSPSIKLVILLERAATDSVIYEVLQNTSHAAILAVVNDWATVRRIQALEIKKLKVVVNFPYGWELPEGTLPYSKLREYIWRGYMLTWWQRAFWPLIPFWHNELKVNHSES